MAKRRTKGEGSIYQRHDHQTCPPAGEDGERPEHRCRGRYVAVVDLGWSAGKRQRRTYYGRTEREVRMKIAEAKVKRDNGVLLSSSPTVDQWMTHWLDVICVERGLKVNTMKSHRSKVETHIRPNLGRYRLDHLAPEHIRAMYARMRADGLAEGTLRQTHAILRRALQIAVRERKVALNVADMIDPPGTQVTTPRTPLTPAEARRVLAEGNLRWWVALYLGLRQGEALGLDWADVDLDAGTITIRQTLVRVPREGLQFGTPKSAASRRVLPLPPKALAHFRLAALDRDTGLVFSGPNGEPIDHRADWQAWQDTLTRLGIEPRALHAARHTAATLLEGEGVPDRMVMDILGQTSVKVTHNYQHSDLERNRAALAAIERDHEVSGDTDPDELAGITARDD